MWGLFSEQSSLLQLALLLSAMFVLDTVFGEPRRWHPLAGFGRWANWLEARLNVPNLEPKQRFISGILAWGFAALLPLVLILILLTVIDGLLPVFFQWLAIVVLGYFCIAARSLREHALEVAEALPIDPTASISDEQLSAARLACSKLVSRDTADASESDMASATVESVLENSNDAVIAPMFWFLLAGLPGMLLFRFSNTLDAMWGYRTERFNLFGRWAARVDDALAYLPARLTVLLFALNRRAALSVALRDGSRWYSPNAGPVMAAGAGALGLQLGGPARYHGELKQRPVLGQGRPAQRGDILSALKLVYRSYLMLLAIVLGLGALL